MGTNNIHAEMEAMGRKALDASRSLARLTAKGRDNALSAMASAIEKARDAIAEANAKDVAAARKAGLKESMVDRLTLTPARFKAMVAGVRDVAALPDPLRRTSRPVVRPSGIRIVRQPVPIGVIAIIFESRPNVTADAAALCVKSGNAVILRGGKEAFATNSAIAAAMADGLASAGLPPDAVQLVRTTDHAAVNELVALEGLVDLVIPRGGESLIRAVVEHARVPVLKHYNGICHIFVDESADAKAALRIIGNAKCQRPSACNAVETVLVHSAIAKAFIPRLGKECAKWGVEVFADEKALAIGKGCGFKAASEESWRREYLGLAMSLAVVDGVEAAIDHINRYGSHHSDAILTRDENAAALFTRDVDSAAVYVNASTRFTDGGEFGFGCEMGISTDKIHARGPVGIKELTSYKYVVEGQDSIR